MRGIFARHLARPSATPTPTHTVRSRVSAVAAALVLVLLGGLLTANPALAATNSSVTMDKFISTTDEGTIALKPGDEFTYTLRAGCDGDFCENLTVTDMFPAELAGFAVTKVSVDKVKSAYDLSYADCNSAATTAPGTMVEGCGLTLVMKERDEGSARTGLSGGETVNISVSMRVPSGLTPGWEFQGEDIVNSATTLAQGLDSATDSATIAVTVPVTVNVATTKTWAPASQQYAPGAASTVTLGVRNTSNDSAASLVLQDPAGADEGADSLPASNPFRNVNFTGFGASTLPQGAATVTVSSYVLRDGVYTWVTGTPAATPGLPVGVTAREVAGIRLSYAAQDGSAIAAGGTAGSAQLLVSQRSTDRVGGASLKVSGSVTVPNNVAGTVTVAGQEPKSANANAALVVTPVTIDAAITKTIIPTKITSTQRASATVTARNASNAPVDRFVVEDLDYFTETLTFGGFDQGLNYPDGATGATIDWVYSDDSASSAAVASGATPVAPAAPAGEHLTGFRITFVGNIAAGASTSTRFGIVPTADYETATETLHTNVAGLTVATLDEDGAVVDSKSATASAPLTVVKPSIELNLEKTIAPSLPVTPGGTVAVTIEGDTVSKTGKPTLNPREIIIDDVATAASTFYDAFDPIAVGPISVLPNSSLTVLYFVDGDPTPRTLTTVAGGTDGATLSAAIPDAVRGTVTGLRYQYTSNADEGFAKGTFVKPRAVYQARATLRGTETPTSVAGAAATTYANAATGSASTPLGDGTVTSPVAKAGADGAVQSFPGADGNIAATKKWLEVNGTVGAAGVTLNAQSAESAITRLGWGVTETGYSSMTITDPGTGITGTPAPAADTTFNAFDLTEIRATSDALMPSDIVQSVQLWYQAAGESAPSWHTVTRAGGWKTASGQFPGYTLTATERALTTAVRLVVVEDTAARNAQTPAKPLALAGTGVATIAVGQIRNVDLVWQLRNKLRTATPNTPWVTGRTELNAGTGVVRNSVNVTGTRTDGGTASQSDHDDVTIVSPLANTTLTKVITDEKGADLPAIVLPNLDDGDRPAFASYRNTITAKNVEAGRASYIRVTDPVECGTACVSSPTAWNANPFASATYSTLNPFEVTTLTNIAFGAIPAAQVDPAASTVTLWHRNGTTNTTSTHSMTAAALLAPAALADVVGVSVLYQGTDPVANGGSIVKNQALTMTLTTQVREYQRSNPTAVVEAMQVDNVATSQLFDPVLNPLAQPNAQAKDSVELLTGVLAIAPTKTITPASRLETERDKPVTVALSANSAASTVASNKVVLEDKIGAGTAEFWNSYALESITAPSIAFTGGANRVRVDLHVDDAWVNGAVSTLGGTIDIPSVDLADVTGVRFTFTRADGTAFTGAGNYIDWSARASFTARHLDTFRDAPEKAIGYPNRVTNSLFVSTERTDLELYAGKQASTTKDVTIEPGTFALDVSKQPEGNEHLVDVDIPTNWTMTVKNTGTGYLTLEKFVDTLPESLEWDGATPVITTGPTGAIPAGLTPGVSTTDFTTSYDAATRKLSIVWNDATQRMVPGESFIVTVSLTLLPGLTAAERATNTMAVTTTQPLSACTNVTPDTQSQGRTLSADTRTCETTNYVGPRPGDSLAVYKGVKGEIQEEGGIVSGAFHPTNPAFACVPNAEGFYSNPCVARTVVGATDSWQLRGVNAGTSGMTSLTMIDSLPQPGENSLVGTGNNRGSDFRPVFDGDAGVTWTNRGASTAGFTWQVSTGDPSCVSTKTSADWAKDSYCNLDWTESAAYTGDWADVTLLRVKFVFDTPLMAKDGAVKVEFNTVNVPVSDTAIDGAPVDTTADVVAARANNNVGGVAYFSSGGSTKPKVERVSRTVGVALQTGSLNITKVVEGAAAAYAPTTFAADITCTVPNGTTPGTTAVEFGGATALTAGAASTVRDIPLGATCAIAETAASAGETTRSAPVTGIRVLGDERVTSGAVLTNSYAYSSLSVTKRIESAATMPFDANLVFDFELSCVAAVSGLTVNLADIDQAFSLRAGETHTVAANTIPANATCELTEVNDQGANRTAITGADVVDAENTVATTVVPAAGTALTVTNGFDAGTLELQKEVTGDGAATFGTGAFAATVTCDYRGTTLFSGDIALRAGESVPVTADDETVVFPIGTVCGVEETTTGGANDTSYTGLDGDRSVTITGPVDEDRVGMVRVLVANDFRLGELAVVKERTGSGLDLLAPEDDAYAAQVACTWTSNGDMLNVALPNAGVVALNADNGFRAVLEGIIVGATCTVVETEAGFAVATTYAPEDGTVTVLETALVEGELSDAPVATVTITNRFDRGSLSITKRALATTVPERSDVSYVVTVTNTGELTATDLPVTDVLPEGARFVAAEGGQYSAGVVTWTIAELVPGQSVDLPVTVSFATAGTYLNRASVVSPPGTWEPSPVDATATVSVVTVILPGIDPGAPLPALPNTGSNPAISLGMAIMLVLAGLGVLVLRRREERTA